MTSKKMISIDELSNIDLEKYFQLYDEIEIMLKTNCAERLKHEWDLYGKYKVEQLNSAKSLKTLLKTFKWILSNIYTAFRYKDISHISNFYYSLGQNAEPVEFRTIDSKLVVVRFRRKVKNHTKNIDELLRLAKSGNAREQYNLAVKFSDGDGVQQDYIKAAKYYNMAALQDLPDAQYALAWLYGNGYGLTKNESEAILWFTKAAKNGNIDAQKILSKAYEDGMHGLPVDESKASYWRNKVEQQEI